MNTFIRATALALVATGLGTAGTAMAQDQAKPAAEQPTVVFMSSQTVARDATTGQLRAVTPVEGAALTASRRVAAEAMGQHQRLHTSGARGVRLTDEFLSHHMMARLPDGSMAVQCLHGPEEAAKFHQQPLVSKATATAPTE